MDRNINREISLIRPYVALRKESVDRNSSGPIVNDPFIKSLSARRAWIEINVGFPIAAFLLSRSPQGERG